MSLNMKSFTQALAKTAAVIEKTVQSTVQEVTGPKPLQDYELVDQVGSGGLGMVWKLYSGRPRNKAEHAHNPEVCVWVLDKKAVAEIRQREGMTKGTEDAFLEIIRADAAQLMKLRHPGVIRVIQALDESKTAMAMVTEPIFCSVSNVLGNMDNVAKFPKELKGLVLGQLEIKHGLLQLAESLHFLHNNAQLIHRAISPETVFITTSGSWKFAGFGHSVSIEQAASEVNAGSPFHYPDYDVEEVFMPLHPHLDYTAPELTRGSGAKRTSSDIFSLACLAYHLISREPLICSKSNLLAYRNTLSYLTSQSFSKMPTDLIQDLQRMLSSDELSRPTANEFTGSPYFWDDTRLRALRFLDHMLERDNMQKTDFLKALSNMWVEFDSRVLRYKVLPPLCSELRNAVMLPMVLPMVLTIAESQEKSDFESSTLPSLLPVLNSASGESLLFLVKHAALLINKVPENMVATVVSMLVRAYDDPDARMQEEVLKRTVFIAKQIDYQVLKQSILSRIHGLALKTTVAAVRVNALLCLGEIVHRLDRNTIGDVLQTLQRCTAVDRSAATLMCTLGVANAIHKQFGLEYSVEHLLPLLTPLLVAQQLNSQQFTKYMHFVKDILRQIEEKRGLTSKKESVNGSAVAAEEMKSKISSSWDKDDWSSQLNSKAKPNILPSFEWPPPSTATSTANSIVTATAAATVTTTATAATTSQSVSDDLDPFADWPPRSYSNNSQQIQQQQQQQKKMMNKKSFHDVNSMSWSSKKPDEFLRLPPPPPSSSTSSLPLSTSSLPSSFSSSSSSTSSSIGLGRGRGRGRGRNSIGQIKSSKTSSQPPLLDLM